jgi:Na+/proline symporter
MEALRDPIAVGSVAFYMLVCIGVGIWAARRTSSTRDFFMAGRRLGVFVTGAAIFSSQMSGFGFVGGPGLVYSMGMASVWMVITTGVGFAVTDFLLAKRLRLFAGLYNALSLPDLVAVRYGSEPCRFLTALAILLGVMGYLATQILAMAIVLQSLVESSDFLPELGLPACAAISTAVLVFYCVTGGVIAGVYTDAFQGVIMAIAGMLVFAVAVSVASAETGGMGALLVTDDPESVGPWGTYGIIGCLSWYFLFALGGAGQPHTLTKRMMVERPADLRFVPLVAAAGYTLTALLWVGIGLAMRSLVIHGSHPELATADAAAPEFLQHYVHPVLSGLVFAGLFAAIMSTADSFLNLGAAAVVHDIPKALRGRSLDHELLWARVATIGLGVAAAAFALYSHYQNERMIALLGAFGWGTFAAALVPTLAIGLNWTRATPRAVVAAIVAGLGLNFGIEVFDVAIPYNVAPGALSLLVSTTLFMGISLASKPRPLPPGVEATMEI